MREGRADHQATSAQLISLGYLLRCGSTKKTQRTTRVITFEMVFNYAALKWVGSDAICRHLPTILDEDNVQLTTASTSQSSTWSAIRLSPCPAHRSLGQCPDAVVAPMPVSERTCWARKPPRSFTAWLLRSRSENNQMLTNPVVIENSAGEVYGNNALPFG